MQNHTDIVRIPNGFNKTPSSTKPENILQRIERISQNFRALPWNRTGPLWFQPYLQESGHEATERLEFPLRRMCEKRQSMAIECLYEVRNYWTSPFYTVYTVVNVQWFLEPFFNLIWQIKLYVKYEILGLHFYLVLQWTKLTKAWLRNWNFYEGNWWYIMRCRCVLFISWTANGTHQVWEMGQNSDRRRWVTFTTEFGLELFETFHTSHTNITIT